MTAASLAAAGWERDPQSGVWRAAGIPGIAYSDGHASEAALLEIVRSAGDLSSTSDELRTQIRDWVTEYHLSPDRANLLRPLPIRSGDYVLELGAGCGALTRWLGESGAEVLAVEGGIQRAAVAASRCRDLPNVRVACADLTKFEIAQQFDWVVLAGVLEYARVFDADAAPELQYLAKARASVARAGCLVLAIENQLGLKYFAGCGEDHVGRPYYGVHGLYAANQAVTFGRAALEALLELAGFPGREFFYPMPDYKLPTTIVSHRAATSTTIALGDMLFRAFSRDYAGRTERAFSENLAWEATASNGLLPELANSFLVVASPNGVVPQHRRPEPSVLAWGFTSGRRKEHAVETLFVDESSGVRVEKRSIAANQSARPARPHPTFARRTETMPYVSGRLVASEVARALARGDAADAVDRLLLRWIDRLCECAIPTAEPATVKQLHLAPDMVDAVPANAIFNQNNQVVFIDLEWIAAQPLPLAWVVLRGLLGLVLCLDDAGCYKGSSVWEIAQRLLRTRNMSLTEEERARAIELDGALVLESSGGNAAGHFPLTEASLQAPVAPRVVLRLTGGAATADGQALRGLLASEQRNHAETIAKLRAVADQAHATGLALLAEQRQHAENVTKVQHLSALAHETQSTNAQLRADVASETTRRDIAETRSTEVSAELASIRARVDALADELAIERSVVDARRIEIDSLRGLATHQQRELAMLHQERATFGAKIGRWLTRQRNAWLPPESRRGRWVTLGAKFMESFASEGTRGALRRAKRFGKQYLAHLAPRESTHTETSVDAVRHGSPDEFDRWIAANEPSMHALDQQKQAAFTLPLQPLVSVILPIFKVPAPVLCATLDSLLAQTYPGWEACVPYADEVGDNWTLLERYASRDPRIRVFRLPENGGISANSNAALATAHGEFVALLDHDDELPPWALFAIAQRLNDQPDLDFLYTDKDSIDAAGVARQDPLFKPEWSPEMLCSVNYLTHFNVIRRALVEAIGGWRKETDGAQDWDLFFRITEKTQRIARVPGIGYHWRILPTSVATGLQAKPYAAAAQLRCQQDRLMRLGLSAHAELHDESGFRIRWKLPSSLLCEIIVHSANDEDSLRACLNALRFSALDRVAAIRVQYPAVATQGSLAEDFGKVWGPRITFEPAGENTASAVARAARNPGAPLLLLIDGRAATFTNDIVDELCGWIHGYPDIAWAAGIALQNDDTVWEAGRVVGNIPSSAPLFRGTPLRSWGWFGGPLWYRNASAASPYAVAVRRADLDHCEQPPIADFRAWWIHVCGALREDSRRGVIDPHARIMFKEDPEPEPSRFDESFGRDPYFHPYFRDVSPLRLTA